MNNAKPNRQPWLKKLVPWTLVTALILSFIASCSSLNRFLNATAETGSPIHEVDDRKRVPLPPLVEDYE
ncbi:MAG: hypothetical protein RDU20_01905 [Desulfomonilaceae bacterium]|nr:hypothetical protein [Desulfomonilaceae bacterium]